MKTIQSILLTLLTIIGQLILGQLLGFGGAMVLGVGNGWELLVIPLGNVLGIWGIGVAMARLRGILGDHTIWLRLFGALIGSGLGVLLILATPATGFSQLLYPLFGALLGYYVAPSLRDYIVS